MPGSFVIYAAYGQLVDGYNATNAELLLFLALPSLTQAQRERADMLLQERNEWRECMRRCPMFVAEVSHG